MNFYFSKSNIIKEKSKQDENKNNSYIKILFFSSLLYMSCICICICLVTEGFNQDLEFSVKRGMLNTKLFFSDPYYRVRT